MSTTMIKENKMGVMPEGKLLANMALPMIISMLVQALYNVVDSIYVSQISESAVTALSLAFPIQNLQIGFAVGLGVGINSLLIGFFAAFYLKNGMSMLYFCAAIIPHGIFEIPALVISIGLGLYLCRTINDFARHNTKGAVTAAVQDILRALCLRAVPLFVIASVIECYITPWIVSFIK